MAILANPSRLSDDVLAKWLIEDLPVKIQIAHVFPFRPVAGSSLKFARLDQGTPPTPWTQSDFGQTISDNGAISDQTNQPAANTTFSFGEIATRYQVGYNAIDQNRVPNEVDAVESALAIRRLIYRFYYMLDQTPGAGSTFPSLVTVIGSNTTQVVDKAGAAPTLDDYDDAYFRIRTNKGRPNAIMSNAAAVKKYLKLMRAAGLIPQYIECEWSDPMRGKVRAPQLALHGTPWYINDCIEARSGPKSNIYFMVLGNQDDDPSDCHGIFGIYPAPLQGTMFVRRETPIMFNDTGTATSNITVDYSWPVGIAVGALGSLSILKDASET